MTEGFIQPPQGLYEKVIQRIHKEQRILAIKNAVIFSITLIGSAIAFVPAYNMLLADFTQSGFLEFFSLIFSDFSVVTAYWKNFTLVLLETLPAISLALFLAVLLVFLQSVRALTKDIKILVQTRLAIN